MVDGKKVITGTSVAVHSITKDGKYGVAKAVSIIKIGNKKNDTEVTLKKGKTAQITAIEKQRQIKLSDYRKRVINEKMETFEDFYYYEEDLEINQLEFKNLFPLIQFLMSYFDLDIEINREMEHSPYVKIYSEKLKIKYELSTEGFEEFLTFLNDDLIHNFFSLLNYRFSNEFEEEQDDEYEIIEDEEDDE